MYPLIRRYLRRVDVFYLLLCAACSAISVVVLLSIGQTQLGSNNKASVQLIASLLGLMLAVVFNILCEGTVYGNSIARKPWHDTIGIGLGALSNFGLCALLVPAFGLTGAALALAASNGLAFLYRSITGQMYYRTVASYPKTISGFLLAFAVTAIGTLLWQHFFIKFALVGVILFIYCTLYRAQLARLWSMGLGILRGIFHRK